MRFGITVTQMDALVPRGVTPEQALDHVANYDQVPLARHLFTHGFDPVELNGDMPLFLPQTFSPADVAGLLALKEEVGLSFTVHLPLWSIELSTPQKHVREGSVRAIVEMIEATRALEPEVFVLHATGALAAEFFRMDLPELAKAYVLRQLQRHAMESVAAILSATHLPTRELAIETVEFPFELTLELAEALDTSICLDTGHLLAGFAGPVDLFEALDRSGDRLGEIHLHDAPRRHPQGEIAYGEDHRPIGAGDLDIGRLVDRLEAMDFTGPLIYELSVPEALESMKAIGELRPDAVWAGDRPSAGSPGA